MARKNQKHSCAGKVLAVSLYTVLFFVLLVVFPGLPPYIEFSKIEVQPPLPLSGPLSINTKLNGAEQLFKGMVKGPECFDIYKNELYFSTSGGFVYKLSGDKAIQVLKVGSECSELWQEEVCGRPLGLKFDKAGLLYIADAYYGIIKANVTTGQFSVEVPVDVPISGKKPMIPNFLDMTKDGKTIFWSDSSTSFYLKDGLYVALGGGDGRLLKYDLKKKVNEVLIDGLFFANGVALSPDESFVVVAETFQRRLLRYHLKGPKAGKYDVFFDGLPGSPDNLRINEKNELVVPLITNYEDMPFLNFILSNIYIRQLVARIMGLLELLCDLLYSLSLNPVFQVYQHWIGHFESILGISKQDRVTIIFLNMKGEITRSLHATDGRISGISDFIKFGDHYYLGSPFNNYLGRVTALA